MAINIKFTAMRRRWSLGSKAANHNERNAADGNTVAKTASNKLKFKTIRRRWSVDRTTTQKDRAKHQSDSIGGTVSTAVSNATNLVSISESAAASTTITSTSTSEVFNFSELQMHRILGAGSFGKVWLVSHSNDRGTETFALKVQKKSKKSSSAGINNEINVISDLKHPFITKLYHHHETESKVFMLLELANGGDLYSVMMRQQNGCLPERSARFYSASILEGLSHMHSRGYVHRDLKPHNILIDGDGYAIIADFGFSKKLEDAEKTYTLCGTPNYMSPEVILRRGQDKFSDYWSWAVLVHEICTGRNPFEHHGPQQMSIFYGIANGDYQISSRAGTEVQDMMKSILVKNPDERPDVHDMKASAWLKDVDFGKLAKKKFTAPASEQKHSYAR